MRIDIFWLPGTRDDSPDGRTPTRAMTTPSIENVALRMSSPRESSMIDVKSSSDIQSRTSWIRLSSKNATAACWSGGLSGGTVLGSTFGGPPLPPDCEDSHAPKHATAANPIANQRPRPFIADIYFFPRWPTRPEVEHGKTRATTLRPIRTALYRRRLPTGNGLSSHGGRIETREIATLRTMMWRLRDCSIVAS